MADKVCHNFALMMLLNGYNYSMIGENILLNGAVIDCESVYNGTNLDHLSFCLDLCIQGKRASRIDIKRLNDWNYLGRVFRGEKDTMICNSSVHGVMLILSRIQEVYEDLYRCKLRSMAASFHNYLNDINKQFTSKNIAEPVRKFMKSFHQLPCETSHRYQKAFPFRWDQQLKALRPHLDEAKPFQLFFVSQTDQKLYLRIRLNFRRFLIQDPLLQAFNHTKRLDMLRESAIILEQTEFSDPIAAASSLNHEINRATLLLPSKLNNEGNLEQEEFTLAGYRKWYQQEYNEPLSVNHKLAYAVFKDDRVHHLQGKLPSKQSAGKIVVYEIIRPDGFRLLTKPKLVNLR